MDIANHVSIIDMIERPAFCVQDGVIVRANKCANDHLFEVGKPVSDFLPVDSEAYEAFQGGYLYLNVTSAHVTSGATVTRIEDFDLFIVDSELPQLEAFSLAATQLKVPLCNLVNIAESMDQNDPQYATQRGHLRKQIYQLSRVVNNMSDVNWLRNESSAKLEATEFSALFGEIMEKMEIMVKAAGYELQFQNLEQPVTGAADRELLLRAVSNILSNAVKFSPKGSLIKVCLVKRGKFLRFIVTDPGSMQDSRCNVFTNFVRYNGLEDARYGLGLGMSIIHAIAVDHGGTVLVDKPKKGGTRVTMTIDLGKTVPPTLRTPVQLPLNNYTAGLDISLVEFSDVLSPEAFETLL